ncbi:MULTISPECIES: glycoside hydrolase family 15 protein [unclassified Sphingomonas]|uniref:glycoside hydrolase family 15 protein n=1 Tax=unclassified Sphingomonas TaxID=196159 RepID=UPI001608F219|nr:MULTISPECIES: glycoside hydrolase family 15 protein [unclassified Sphingomonas]MBB3347518.1 GH15 family glucan-1,4-alpha-glucosidase [Sphingomonas sp. BK069]MBB3472313.1 GH15 family glucan-1,4-alpha-glucosidase [Sphingomonas sp. BK345]
MTNLDLWPIGNCQVSALVDRQGRFVWGCVPRVDGDPLFSSLLGGEAPDSGYWGIEIEDSVSVEQEYIRNTPILVTRHVDSHGGAIEVIDFCPRFQREGRTYRPVGYARIIRPVAGSPRVRVKLRPTCGWGGGCREQIGGSNHLRLLLDTIALRLTTTAPIAMVQGEHAFRVERPLHFFLGPDESFQGDLASTVDLMLYRTTQEWQGWVRGLAVPLEWQETVIRCAITLKLCQHEETGAIVAALTTSVPEHAGSQRNWDYRYCWIRDAYYTVQALNRLGALDVLEGYLGYLRNIVDAARGGHIQPLYGVLGEAELPERIEEQLAGYRGMGPVRVGNQAAEQIQHDAYGQIVLCSVHAFFDHRLFRLSGVEDFEALERVGERAWAYYDQPDAGLWELRTRQSVHTYSSAMCWAACDRLANAAERLGLAERQAVWAERAQVIRDRIESAAWREETRRMSATFAGDDLDASVLQLLDLRFLEADDPRFLDTLSAIETGLRRGSTMLRYDTEDDFGLPETAFNVCTFWLIEALYLTGRSDEARALFEEMLTRCTAAGLLSEDIDPHSGELWGNYPQTYSLVGMINCAAMLSKPWSSIR